METIEFIGAIVSIDCALCIMNCAFAFCARNPKVTNKPNNNMHNFKFLTTRYSLLGTIISNKSSSESNGIVTLPLPFSL